MVTWKPLPMPTTATGGSSAATTSNAAGLPPLHDTADRSRCHLTPSGYAARLPSVVTWAAHETYLAVPRAAGAGLGDVRQEVQDDREDEAVQRLRAEEEARASSIRAASDKQIANLRALKAQLLQAKTIVGELRGQRAAAEAQLSEMEGALAQTQHAANQRLWDAAVEGHLEDIRCDAPRNPQLVGCLRYYGAACR